MDTKGRNINLDITRIFAVMAVVMIHTSGEFVKSYDIKSTEFLWGNIFDSISRIGVPFFVMISGSLMLDEDRDISIKDIFFKNIKNIVLLYVLWSALYCLVYNVALPIANGEPLNVPAIISSLVMGHFHMWYLPMTAGLYLITPFLRELVKKKNKNMILLLIAISIATQFVVPLVNSLSLIWEKAAGLLHFVKRFNLEFLGQYFTYYIIGWYIVHIGIRKKLKFYCLGITSLIITVLYVQFTKDYQNAYLEENIFVLAYSVSVFIALNCGIQWKINDKMKGFLVTLSKLSFGVYIVHPMLQAIVSEVLIYTKNPFMYILVYFGIVIILSFIVCHIASKLPVIKKAFRS